MRELENAIERAVVLAEGDTLLASDLLLDASDGKRIAEGPTLQAALDSATAQAIRSALDATGGVKGLAAERLAIDRTTLYRLIRKYALETDD